MPARCPRGRSLLANGVATTAPLSRIVAMLLMRPPEDLGPGRGRLLHGSGKLGSRIRRSPGSGDWPAWAAARDRPQPQHEGKGSLPDMEDPVLVDFADRPDPAGALDIEVSRRIAAAPGCRWGLRRRWLGRYPSRRLPLPGNDVSIPEGAEKRLAFVAG